MKIRTRIHRITFHAEDTGYTILKTKDKPQKTLVGHLQTDGKDLIDMEVLVEGEWIADKTYGKQFKFKTIKVEENEMFYFLAKVVKGLGRRLAGELMNTYSEQELEDIIENRPKELLNFKGIKKEKLKKIKESWSKHKQLKEYSKALTPFGASIVLLNKVYRHFNGAEEKAKEIQKNPYILTGVAGIGFKKADTVAIKMGIPKNSTNRIKAAIKFSLEEYTEQQGNSKIRVDLLFNVVKKILTEKNEEIYDLDINLYNKSLSELLTEQEIVVINNQEAVINFQLEENLEITTKQLYRAEKHIYDLIEHKTLTRDGIIEKNIDVWIEKKEKELGFILSQDQKDAIKMVNEGLSVFALAGYAGSGKSTISKLILDLISYGVKKEDIVCCAISGIASDRIRKTTGYNSQTIASLLIQAKKEKGINKKIILIDEASMINSKTMSQLLSNINYNTKLILVGDPAQLPPIGAGSPFSDIINLKLTNIAELVNIHRQAPDKVIASFANQIRVGKVPENFEADIYDDWKYYNVSVYNYQDLKKKYKNGEISEIEWNTIKKTNRMKIQSYIKRLVEKMEPDMKNMLKRRDFQGYIRKFQIITPIKGYELGTEELNNVIQKTINPQYQENKILKIPVFKDEKTGHIKYKEFHLFDKIVHTRNADMDCIEPENMKRYSEEGENITFQARIFNGMLGIIAKIDHETKDVFVYYPAEHIIVIYSFEEAIRLTMLAYAMTIHKTQGAEFDEVIMPITNAHFIMLNTKLLYTAITRAKNKINIVGEYYAMTGACRKLKDSERETVMQTIHSAIE